MRASARARSTAFLKTWFMRDSSSVAEVPSAAFVFAWALGAAPPNQIGKRRPAGD